MIAALRRAVGIFSLGFPLCAAAAAGLNLDDTVSRTGLSSAAISPNGRHVIGIGYKRNLTALVLIDADTGAMKMVDDNFWDMPESVRWINDDLIAVQYSEESQSMELSGHRVSSIGYEMLGKVASDDPNSTLINVLLSRYSDGLAQVDARTGKMTKLSYPSAGKLMKWAFDTHGVLRAVTLRDTPFWGDKTVTSNWYRSGAKGEWIKLADFGLSDRRWWPVAVMDDDTTLEVMSNVGRDTTALFSFDTRTLGFTDMLIGHPTEDLLMISGASLTNPDRVITNGMKLEQYWLNNEWAAAQAAVDRALPNRINRLSGNPKGRLLVFSWSDVDPGGWYLVDMAKSRVSLLLNDMPKLDVGKMRPKQITSYAARDGLQIPAYLTLPAGGSDHLPLVVVIHGGPWMRDVWDWDVDVQMLASHGYAVFQPQFRGSSGFGVKFMELGYGQWGLSMQDDITDGVQYLISKGIADPHRICIYGASYGGYAALWGMVKTPELYRCGVSFAGVSDIGKHLTGSSDANDSKLGREYMRFAIGDAKLNQAQFDAVSPLKHADRIQAPILLMHGDRDQRVPLSSGSDMDDVLTKLGKPHEWYVFEGEGHGLYYLDSEKVYYKKLLAFLKKYIGPEAGAPAKKE